MLKISERRFLFIFISIVIFMSAACNRDSDSLTVDVRAPQPYGEYSDEVYADALLRGREPLAISFDNGGGPSPANMELIGKTVPSGASVSPYIPGVWKWADEYNLFFTPDLPWTAGTRYEVVLEPSVFNKTLEPRRKRIFYFETPPLEAYAVSSGIYRAPDERRTPRFNATIEFNYPVSAEEFKKRAKLTVDNETVGFSAVFDNKTLNMYINSDPVSILDYPRKFVFQASGFTSEGSSHKYPEVIRESAVVPPLGSFFRVETVSAGIVRDDKDEPEQIVTVDTTAESDRNEFDKHVSLYLLPKYLTKDGVATDEYPKNEGRRVSSHRWEYEDLEMYKPAGKRLPLVRAPSEGLPETVHPYVIDVDDDAPRYVLAKIDPGFLSRDGFPMNVPSETIIEVPGYPEELKIVAEGGIMPLGGENPVVFASRGIKELELRIGKVIDYQIKNVIDSTASGGLVKPDFKDGLDQTNFTDLYYKKVPIPGSSNKKISYAAANLNDFTADKGPGLYFVSAQGGEHSVERLILVTDMGLILKKNADLSSDLFVVSLKEGRPVKGARVDVIGKNGLPVYSGTTDERGHFGYPDLSDYRADKEPIAVTASVGDDMTFLPLHAYDRAVEYSSFNVGGIYGGSNQEGLDGYLFSDRGIYRPGEEIKIGGIVKQSDWKNLSGIPVEAEITDPNEKSVYTKRFTLTKEGIFELTYKSGATSPTGVYNVSLYLLEGEEPEIEKTLIGSAGFRVEEFESESMTVKAFIKGSSPAGWAKPGRVSGTVAAKNLFGVPAQGRTVEWQLTVSPAIFRFDGYKDYSFTDPLADSRGRVRGYSEELPAGKTDLNGEASTKFDIDKFSAGTYRLSLTARVSEPGSGDGASAYASALVSPLDFIIGYKTVSKLNFLPRNSEASVSLIAVNENLEKTGAPDLIKRFVSVEYVTSLVRNAGGAYGYQSVEKRKIVSEEPFFLSSSGTDVVLPTSNAGRFVMEITDKNGRTLCSVPYFVAGTANISGGIEKNAVLTLQLDKTRYEPGEEIIMNIIAPYGGAGLITLERDRVYAFKWFKTDTTSTVQTIKIPEGMENGGYVNVSFVRGYDSEEIFTDPHSYAVAYFSLNIEKRRAGVSLNAPAKAEPGDEIKITYETDKDAEIIIFGADEGILLSAGYSSPDPLSYFFKKRALEVRTYQTVDLVLPDFKIMGKEIGIGGDYGEAAMGLNPFKRILEKPVSFWSGILTAEAGKKGEISFKIPDYFNGTLRIMAVAASAEAVGSASVSAVSRAPVVMSPNIPAAVAPGDVFEVPLGVYNGIEKAEDFSSIRITAVASPNLEIVGESSFEEDVPRGAERTMVFRVKALDVPGAASVKFSAESESLEKPVFAAAAISVRPPTPFVSALNTGTFTAERYDIKNIFRDMYDNLSVRKGAVSADPLAALAGTASYLETYPHGCTEQITSGVFPLIYLTSSADGITFSAYEARARMKKVVDVLKARQTPEGDFYMWPEGGYAYDFVSVYVLHMLTEARDAGFSVPASMLEKGKRWLASSASYDPEDMWDARTRAYAIYVLARNGVVVTRYINRLEEYLDSVYADKWKSDLTASYLGAAYVLMKQDAKGRAYLKSFKPEGKKYVLYNDYDSSSTRNADYLYLVARYMPEELPKFRDLASGIIADISDGHYNTLSSADFIRALGSYPQAENESVGNVSVTEIYGDGARKKLDVVTNPYPSFVFENGADALRVIFPEKSNAGYYYYVLQNGFDKNVPNAASSRMEITREYLDGEGNPIKGVIRQGQELTVRIRTRINPETPWTTAILTDILPGGFEAVRDSVVSESLEFYDVREDRILFYAYVGQSLAEITYKVRALAAGEFLVPPVYARSMYDRTVWANTAPGKITVEKSAE